MEVRGQGATGLFLWTRLRRPSPAGIHPHLQIHHIACRPPRSQHNVDLILAGRMDRHEERKTGTQFKIHGHAGLFSERSAQECAGHVYFAQGTTRTCRIGCFKTSPSRKPCGMNRMGEESYRPLCPHLSVAHALLEPQPNLSTNKPTYERGKESWNARVVSVVAKMRASADFL